MAQFEGSEPHGILFWVVAGALCGALGGGALGATIGSILGALVVFCGVFMPLAIARLIWAPGKRLRRIASTVRTSA